MAGLWDDALDEAPVIRARAVARGDAWVAFMADMVSTGIGVSRGEVRAPPAELMGTAITIGLEPSVGAGIWASAALEGGDRVTAARIVDDTVESTRPGRSIYGAAELVSVAIRLGDLALARRVLEKAVPESPSGRGRLTSLATGLLLEAEGDPAAALEHLEPATAFFGAREWTENWAMSLLATGRCRLALGDAPDGLVDLQEARRLAEDLGAQPLLRDIDAAIGGWDSRVPTNA
jgi:tetratricopeptide (TPR) repeat protein